MRPEVAVIVLMCGGALLSLMGLTAAGQRRRGHRVGLALLAGVFFPITWTAWYLRDERSGRATRHV